MKALSVYGAGAALASTSSNVGRICVRVRAETAKLCGRDPDEDSISSSDSESDEDDVGESSGVTIGVEVQGNIDDCKDFFRSIALIRHSAFRERLRSFIHGSASR